MTMITLHHVQSKAWKISGLLAVLVVAGTIGPALAQTDWDMQNRIKRLENEIDTLSRAVYRGEKPPPGSFSGGNAAASANVEVRLQQMETEIQGLRGQLEEQSFEIRQMKDQVERFTSDMELRINDLEGGAGGGSVRSGQAQPQSGGRYTASPVRNDHVTPSVGQGAGQTYQWSSGSGASEASAQQLGSYTASGNGGDLAAATYENAFAMVKNRQYKAAQVEFERFLNDYPDHALAGNARYWLGETHYVRGEFDQAARIFAEGYQKDPQGSKAGDNLLKLGLSLDATGKREDACVALRQLKTENPAGAAPVLRRADQEMNRLGC